MPFAKELDMRTEKRVVPKKITLMHYKGTEFSGEEYIVISTGKYMDDVGDLELVGSVELEGDFSLWPTDRLLSYSKGF